MAFWNTFMMLVSAYPHPHEIVSPEVYSIPAISASFYDYSVFTLFHYLVYFIWIIFALVVLYQFVHPYVKRITSYYQLQISKEIALGVTRSLHDILINLLIAFGSIILILYLAVPFFAAIAGSPTQIHPFIDLLVNYKMFWGIFVLTFVGLPFKWMLNFEKRTVWSYVYFVLIVASFCIYSLGMYEMSTNSTLTLLN